MHELDWEKLCRNLVVKEFKLYSELTQLRTFQRSPFLDEELSSCGVDLACRTVFVVKDKAASNGENLLSRTLRKAPVLTASYALQASHADFFPFPWKDDVASQPGMT